MIKCLLTEFGRAGQENIWLSVMTHATRGARSIRHDLEPNQYFPVRSCHSVNKYILFYQKDPFGEVFSKIIFKSSIALSLLRKIKKFKYAKTAADPVKTMKNPATLTTYLICYPIDEVKSTKKSFKILRYGPQKTVSKHLKYTNIL